MGSFGAKKKGPGPEAFLSFFVDKLLLQTLRPMKNETRRLFLRGFAVPLTRTRLVGDQLRHHEERKEGRGKESRGSEFQA